jgi:hypothetical protein
MAARVDEWGQMKWMQAGCYALTDGNENKRESSLVATDEGLFVSDQSTVGPSAPATVAIRVIEDELGDDGDWD